MGRGAGEPVVECNCAAGEKIVVDSITRGSGKDMKLALAQRPSPVPSPSLPDNVSANWKFCNQLTVTQVIGLMNLPIYDSK